MYVPLADKAHLVQLQQEPGLPLTDRCETDVRTAATRGLAEYLQQIYLEGPAGRKIIFDNVVYNWAEGDPPPPPPRVDPAARTPGFPGAVITCEEDATYEMAMGAGMSSRDEVQFIVTDEKQLVKPPQRLWAWRPSEFSSAITVEVWATDKTERMWITKMLEDELNPVEWMSGFRLNLPHYHGIHASYLFDKGSYHESATDTKRRIWKATFRGMVQLPHIRIIGAPKMHPHLEINVDGVDHDVYIDPRSPSPE